MNENERSIWGSWLKAYLQGERSTCFVHLFDASDLAIPESEWWTNVSGPQRTIVPFSAQLVQKCRPAKSQSC